MNKYIKPTFMFASLAVNSNTPANCGISAADRANLFEGLEKEEIDMLFGINEACQAWVEGYCKFTSAVESSDGSIKQAFFS
jgi:hypothetical protein